MYRHDYSSPNTSSGSSDLFDSTFYFMTSDFRVYKVLDNNGGSAFSGLEPTSESTSPFASGGYVLKYMYTISTSDFSKFGTTDFIPVATDSTVSAAATDGKIVKVLLSHLVLVTQTELIVPPLWRWNKSRNKFWCYCKDCSFKWCDCFFWIDWY